MVEPASQPFVRQFAPPDPPENGAVRPPHLWRQSRERHITPKQVSHYMLKRLADDKTTVQPRGNRSRSYQVVKRALDLIGALTLVVVLFPVLAALFLTLCVTTRGKPLFIQQRVGLCGRKFPLLKFRTMRLDADKIQHLMENEKDGPIFKNRRDPRITRLGALLRRSSLDETPQLFNVIMGDMSLVGPRPPVPKEVVQYRLWQHRRLSVKPGLTCLWQVSGRSNIGFETWVRMDLWYIEHQSLRTDLKLLALTPWNVLTGRGAY